jgi:hypothetical protein
MYARRQKSTVKRKDESYICIRAVRKEKTQTKKETRENETGGDSTALLFYICLKSEMSLTSVSEFMLYINRQH